MKKIPKRSAGYIHEKDTNYTCGECAKRRGVDQCAEYKKSEFVSFPYGSCNLYSIGVKGTNFISVSTKQGTGYMESKDGFSCKRCEYFLPETRNCKKVDRNSPGPDPGVIHPNGCCNLWDD